MRARLIILLALGCWLGPSQVSAQAQDADFDDDFGQLPAAAPPRSPARGGASTSAPEAPADTTYAPLDDAPSLARPRSRFGLLHPTVEGLLGGVHTVDGSGARPGTFRVALSGGFFRKNGFSAHADHFRSSSAQLVLDVTPIEHLELAAQLATRSTEGRTMDPHVVQVVGDMHLFAKSSWQLLPYLHVAGDAELALLNGVGSIGLLGSATSLGLRGSATLDLRERESAPWPLIIRSNLRYLFDNSGRLGRAVERDRYDSLNTQTPRADEFRQLLSPAERNALQVNRVDRIGMSLGFEVPLLPHPRVPVSPLLEWSFALPVNRQGYDCLQTSIAGQRDRCLAHTGFGARPSTLTLGARVSPYADSLALLLAVDLATSGSRSFVRELAPLERYVIRLGVSYAFDTHRSAPQVRIERVEIPAASPNGHVVGEVVDAQSGAAIGGASVHFEGTSLSDLLSDATGTFKSAELPSGAHGMRVRADGYIDSLCIATLGSQGVDVAARCELTPSAHYGTLSGLVADTTGKPVAGAHLALSGAGELSLTSKKDGSVQSEKLLEGGYQLTVSAPGYFVRELPLKVERGAEARPRVVLLARPAVSSLRLTPTRIVTTRPIAFEGETAILAEASQSLLGELAELLQQHPQLSHIEIAAHVDDSLGASAALLLTEQRASAVRDWLVSANVASERLVAKGYGSTRPVVPNLTKNNRARNRRIELLIK